MAQYSTEAFKAYYGVNSAGAPFEDTFAATISGVDMQQFSIDLADSFLNILNSYSMATVTISSASLRTCGSVPVNILGAAGANKYHAVVKIGRAHV